MGGGIMRLSHEVDRLGDDLAFPATLQAKGRAQLIGSGTCGCVLAIRNRHALPDGGVLDVSEFDYKTAGGVRLEGAGIKPDKVITLTRSDVYSRHDRALERALDYLDKSL